MFKKKQFLPLQPVAIRLLVGTLLLIKTILFFLFKRLPMKEVRSMGVFEGQEGYLFFTNNLSTKIRNLITQ